MEVLIRELKNRDQLVSMKWLTQASKDQIPPKTLRVNHQTVLMWKRHPDRTWTLWDLQSANLRRLLNSNWLLVRMKACTISIKQMLLSHQEVLLNRTRVRLWSLQNQEGPAVVAAIASNSNRLRIPQPYLDQTKTSHNHKAKKEVGPKQHVQMIQRRKTRMNFQKSNGHLWLTQLIRKKQRIMGTLLGQRRLRWHQDLST